MPIDLSKLAATDTADTVLHPRDIFSALPAKASTYQYPRDVQSEVWNAWFAQRTTKDLVVKMNTGSGKTVVGLMILKSCLNEGKGPAAYFAPDNYLVRQVLAEAQALGMETTTDPFSAQFLAGRAILVANIYKLFNGLSVFGVGNEGAKIPIGSLLIDDVHACLVTTEGQFTLKAEAPSDLYEAIFGLFRDDLAQQSATSFLDVEAHDPGKYMMVPFWAWIDKNDQVAAALHAGRADDQLKFTWPLLKEVLRLCQSVVGSGAIEITSRCLPIAAVPSFTHASRRIFMTATLADDSVLVSNFDAAATAAESPITPSNANDVGERLILVPQELNPAISDDELADYVKTVATDHNAVVIVPSGQRATFWEDRADLVLTAANLSDGVNRLKAGHVGLVVIVNKYDGIDLPDAACRLLVLDGIPDVRRGIDRIEEAMLHGTPEYLAQVMQRIEQGMGRGIRSNEDHCVVLLMGRSLTKQLYVDGAISKLTPATRAQFELSQRLGQQVRGKGIAELDQAIRLVLGRDPDWVRLSKGALVQVKYESAGVVSDIAKYQRAAFNAAEAGDHSGAIASIQEAVNNAAEPRVKGWLKQQLAEYVHPMDPVEAQIILKSAVADNRLCLRPHQGISYERLRTVDRAQAPLAAEFIASFAPSGNDLLVGTYGHLEVLKFIQGTATVFERSLAWLARLLGFDSQRPEAEFGVGPDVLWSVGQLRYFVIECKNGATNGIIGKADCNQLTGSLNWFTSRYDSTCSPIPIMVHPVNVVDKAASPHKDMRVLTIQGLADLKAAVHEFALAASGKPYPPAETRLGDLLLHLKLTPTALIQAYTVAPKYAK